MSINEKQVIAICGPNGSGKTTFYDSFIADDGITFINADLIKMNMGCTDQEAQQIATQTRADMTVAGENYCYETVFSHVSKVDELDELKRSGYHITLIIIGLNNPDLNVARVSTRVEMGKHHVPEDKIRGRIPRTFANLKTALPFCDEVLIYDNSYGGDSSEDDDGATEIDTGFNLQASISNGELTIDAQPLENWVRDLLIDYL